MKFVYNINSKHFTKFFQPVYVNFSILLIKLYKIKNSVENLFSKHFHSLLEKFLNFSNRFQFRSKREIESKYVCILE